MKILLKSQFFAILINRIMGYTQTEFVTMFLALLVILTTGVILRFTLRKAPLAVRQIPLSVLGATILILEIIKQTYHLIVGDWCAWFIPLHFCSFFLVWYTVALFTRGKLRQLMYFCSITGGFMVTVLLFLAPRMILHEAAGSIWDTFDHFHTFFYHMGVVAYWVWMLMLNVYCPERQHIRKTVITYTIFYFVILVGAFIFQQNYTNALYSDIAILDNFRLTAGQFSYDAVLISIGVVSIALVSSATYFVLSKLYQHYMQKDTLHIKEN